MCNKTKRYVLQQNDMKKNQLKKWRIWLGRSAIYDFQTEFSPSIFVQNFICEQINGKQWERLKFVNSHIHPGFWFCYLFLNEEKNGKTIQFLTITFFCLFKWINDVFFTGTVLTEITSNKGFTIFPPVFDYKKGQVYKKNRRQKEIKIDRKKNILILKAIETFWDMKSVI